MNVTGENMIAMPMQHVQILKAVTSAHATNRLQEMASIAQVRKKAFAKRTKLTDDIQRNERSTGQKLIQWFKQTFLLKRTGRDIIDVKKEL